MEFIKEIAITVFSIFNAMSFYLLLGFLFAGILHVLVPQQLFSKYLSANNWISVFIVNQIQNIDVSLFCLIMSFLLLS